MAFSKLFIPRKNYLVGAKDLPKNLAQDELANYLAIERWANSLVAPAGVRSDVRIVAASNSWSVLKSGADFVCTGTGDDATIQSAINAVENNGNSFGDVLLAPGTYNFGTGGVSSTSGGTMLIGMGYSTPNISAVQITIPANATAAFHDLQGIENLYVNVSGPLTAMGEAILFQPTFVRKVRITSSTFSAGIGVMLQTAANTLGVVEECYFATQRSATGLTCIQAGVGIGTGMWIRENFVDGGLGIVLTGAGTSKIFVLENVLNVCTQGGISLGSTVTECLIEANQIIQGTSATTDGITVSGTRNTVRGNIVKRDGATMRNGINVLNTATNCVVLNNDLRLSGTTNSLLDNGVGTVKNYDGSANNWNLL